MKNNNFPLHTLMLLFALSAMQCRKPEIDIIREKRPTELPPITTEGKSTFGCLVDGELFVPYPQQRLNNFYFVYYGGELGTLNTGAKMDEGGGYISKSVSFDLYNRVFDVGEYVLYTDTLPPDSLLTLPSNYNNVRVWIAARPGKATFESYGVPNPNSGRLRITRLDTIERIIAGTFYFDAVNKEGDTIKVTNGRFDRKY